MPLAKSASSSRMFADLPPSSRKHFFTVSAQSRMMARPVAVEPVNDSMSTRSSVVRTRPDSRREDGTTFTTPGGMSVFSATSRPMIVAAHGVSGEGFSTIVQPLARAGATFVRFRYTGKLNGVIMPTTPMGSRSATPLWIWPMNSMSGSGCSYSYEAASSAK